MMTKVRVGGYSAVLGVALLAAATGGPLAAQAERDSLVQAALDEFDTGRRLQLLVPAVNPALGPLSGSWATGVQLLGQTLLEERQDSLAATWLRWAGRISPDLQPDTLQFLPAATSALRQAQEYVQRTQSPADSLALTSHTWPAENAGTGPGRLAVNASGRSVALGTGPLTQGQPIELPAGSYLISATGPGADSIAITREVLPGVTTAVELRAPGVAVAPPPAAPAPQPGAQVPVAVVEKEKKKFPWLVLVGVAAAGGAVAALAGGGGGGDGNGATTGGITFTFPDP